MRRTLIILVAVLASSAFAQAPAVPPPIPAGKTPFLHDPSTVIFSSGRYWVFATGRGIPFFSSPDGLTWTREATVFTAIPEPVHALVPLNDGLDVWAPDIIQLHGTFFLYYAVSKWGSFASAVALATNTTLDPHDPAYRWVDRGVVVRSDGLEDLNAIDPGVISAPDGTLWLSYGSYHGPIDLIQLDPATGLRLAPASPVSLVATRSEASDIIFHNGFYYLFVNHGSCCKGKLSTYHIGVGRSRTVTGPYVDRHGNPLTQVEGEPFLASTDILIGPGHFGRVIQPSAPERFSVHYEADLNRDGRPVLAIRPLAWSPDGWPVPAN